MSVSKGNSLYVTDLSSLATQINNKASASFSSSGGYLAPGSSTDPTGEYWRRMQQGLELLSNSAVNSGHCSTVNSLKCNADVGENNAAATYCSNHYTSYRSSKYVDYN